MKWRIVMGARGRWGSTWREKEKNHSGSQICSTFGIGGGRCQMWFFLPFHFIVTRTIARYKCNIRQRKEKKGYLGFGRWAAVRIDLIDDIWSNLRGISSRWSNVPCIIHMRVSDDPWVRVVKQLLSNTYRREKSNTCRHGWSNTCRHWSRHRWSNTCRHGWSNTHRHTWSNTRRHGWSNICGQAPLSTGGHTPIGTGGHTPVVKDPLAKIYYTNRLDPDVSRICTIIFPWGMYPYRRWPMRIAGPRDIFQSKVLERMATLDSCELI